MRGVKLVARGMVTSGPRDDKRNYLPWKLWPLRWKMMPNTFCYSLRRHVQSTKRKKKPLGTGKYYKFKICRRSRWELKGKVAREGFELETPGLDRSETSGERRNASNR